MSSREGQRATIMSVMRDQRITKSKERRGTAGDHKGLCWRMREIRDGARTQGDRKGSPNRRQVKEKERGAEGRQSGGVTGNSSCEKIEEESHISISSQQEGDHDHCTTN